MSEDITISREKFQRIIDQNATLEAKVLELKGSLEYGAETNRRIDQSEKDVENAYKRKIAMQEETIADQLETLIALNERIRRMRSEIKRLKKAEPLRVRKPAEKLPAYLL